MTVINLRDENDTQSFGARLAFYLQGAGAVHIYGQLGAGKTTLCRGILRGMGHLGAVKSPTFTLVEPYEVGGALVYHFDLYRLSDPNELDYIGIEEYFGEGKLCLIEWPEKAFGQLPEHDLEITIESVVQPQADANSTTDVSGNGNLFDRRRVTLRANSLHGEKICHELAIEYGK